jgi:hypothetical protein
VANDTIDTLIDFHIYANDFMRKTGVSVLGLGYQTAFHLIELSKIAGDDRHISLLVIVDFLLS